MYDQYCFVFVFDFPQNLINSITLPGTWLSHSHDGMSHRHYRMSHRFDGMQYRRDGMSQSLDAMSQT